MSLTTYIDSEFSDVVSSLSRVTAMLQEGVLDDGGDSRSDGVANAIQDVLRWRAREAAAATETINALAAGGRTALAQYVATDVAVRTAAQGGK